jgi:hypothetical protein
MRVKMVNMRPRLYAIATHPQVIKMAHMIMILIRPNLSEIGPRLSFPSKHPTPIIVTSRAAES